MWLWYSDSRKEALANAKIGKAVFGCSACGAATKKPEVDHIVPAGSLKCAADLPGFVSRLFCGTEGLAVLCRECHAVKTYKRKKAS